MTSISTDGHPSKQAQPSQLRTWKEQAVTTAFLITSAVVTVGWLYVLAEGALAVVNWLFS
ncbi:MULTISPECIES: hypothetical protein [unclassified Bradyrhizobium]|uniref:hypothetical protein n=1 Tax=unclassified Bradyrhizobium TaxID=2631580 RepID=UPI00247B10E5|nr:MULTISPECIES: hypothetical protein [unclassified Bradyrhizobium]WGR70736.1 hypothetical protein MTX24_36385 [Bradyrhizobium sp. ISRA426]WGR75575.1 hypothetical protein MTX21_21490 [Bradyrhizobium sp. ISRA430]WGR85978.1 hypothetical protein MTX25_36075 [Bradyrhizobium sp. ISRA432]